MVKDIVEKDMYYPPQIDSEARSLLRKLLCKDKDKRLGAGEKDAWEIKKHPFFRSVDWAAMERKEVSVPFLPLVRSAGDTQNIDRAFTGEPLAETPNASNLEEKEHFEGFSYHKRALKQTN